MGIHELVESGKRTIETAAVNIVVIKQERGNS